VLLSRTAELKFSGKGGKQHPRRILSISSASLAPWASALALQASRSGVFKTSLVKS